VLAEPPTHRPPRLGDSACVITTCRHRHRHDTLPIESANRPAIGAQITRCCMIPFRRIRNRTHLTRPRWIALPNLEQMPTNFAPGHTFMRSIAETIPTTSRPVRSRRSPRRRARRLTAFALIRRVLCTTRTQRVVNETTVLAITGRIACLTSCACGAVHAYFRIRLANAAVAHVGFVGAAYSAALGFHARAVRSRVFRTP